ncbi:Maf family protein [Pseudomonadota bacterium]
MKPTISEKSPALVLASASPRRHELLEQIGVPFVTVVAGIDEIAHPGESARDFVLRMAREKALEVLKRRGESLPVLGSDTAVILDDEILGKPVDRDEAVLMLGRLSGRTHEVYSAVAVAVNEKEIYEALNMTRVTFAVLDAAWIESYCDTGDPMDKAGAYGVQGKAAEQISRIEGSFYGVMGLPLYETVELLKRAKVIF